MHVHAMRIFSLLIIFMSSIFTIQGAGAHEISAGYLTLDNLSDTKWEGSLSLSPVDLELAVGLDQNQDGELMWGEVLASSSALTAFVKHRLDIGVGEKLCAFQFTAPLFATISGQKLIKMPFTLTCPTGADVAIHYQGLTELDDSHKVLSAVTIGEQTYSDVFTSSHTRQVVNPQNTGVMKEIATFVYQGIVHILIGFDHILFLIATLLTVNLARANHAWEGAQKRKTVLRDTLILVTAFTLAHSVTLTATALGWYHPSSRWVEIGIAISVLLTALNNIWPVIHRLGWITFGFGLLHGMGFASVFAELQVQSDNLLLTIASFNIGVEIGQLAIVLVLLPILLGLRHVKWYARYLMPGTSAVIAVIALNWAIQRW